MSEEYEKNEAAEASAAEDVKEESSNPEVQENETPAEPESATVPSDSAAMETAESIRQGNELIRELLKAQKKQLRTDRLRTAVVMLFLLGIIAVGFFIFREYQQIEKAVQTIQASVDSINTDEINEADIALTGAANSLQKVDTDQLNDSVTALEGAAANLGEVDIEELNKTIAALELAASNLGDMDIDQLNDLIESLNKTAESLEKTSEGIKNFFSFGRNKN